MATGTEAARVWLHHHSPACWLGFLREYEERQCFDQEIDVWLSAAGVPCDPTARDDGSAVVGGPKSYHFEEAFVANVQAAVDRLRVGDGWPDVEADWRDQYE